MKNPKSILQRDALIEFEALLADTDTATLEKMADKLAQVLSERTVNSSPAGVVYDGMKNMLRTATKDDGSSRFTFQQLESFRSWRALPQTKKTEFNKAFKAAITFFTELGFSNNKALAELIVKMVIKSRFVQGNLSFVDIITAFKSMEEVFEDAFPGYLQDEASIAAIRKKLDERQKS